MPGCSAARTTFLALSLLIAGNRGAAAQPAPAEEAYALENPVDVAYLQQHLKEERPRLIMTPERVQRLREKRTSDPVIRNVYEAIKRNAEASKPSPSSSGTSSDVAC